MGSRADHRSFRPASRWRPARYRESFRPEDVVKGRATAADFRDLFGASPGEALNPAGKSRSKPFCAAAPWRSEEHTSELQSRRDLVCRLLLEKKKNTH